MRSSKPERERREGRRERSKQMRTVEDGRDRRGGKESLVGDNMAK
jgi:hypothetical protein